jgi:hypothetical protein
MRSIVHIAAKPTNGIQECSRCHTVLVDRFDSNQRFYVEGTYLASDGKTMTMQAQDAVKGEQEQCSALPVNVKVLALNQSGIAIPRWLVATATYIMAGGMAALGFVAKDFDTHSTLDQVQASTVDATKQAIATGETHTELPVAPVKIEVTK